MLGRPNPARTTMIQFVLSALFLFAPSLFAGGSVDPGHAVPLVPAPGDEPVEGWLAWRGPLQCGVSLETGLPDCFEPEGENQLWSLDLRGRGTPVIANGRVYSLGYRGEGVDLREGILCLDETSGKVLWERWWNDFLSDVVYDRYSIGSPSVDPETGDVFVLNTPGVLMAMTRDGKPLWERDLSAEYGRLTFPNGRTGAPAIDDGLVIVNIINGHWGKVEGPARTRLYAFDKRTGQNVWCATPGGPPKDSSFCFPLFEWRGGRRLLYGVGGGGYVFCIDARSGQTMWRYQVSPAGMNSSTLIHGDKLIAINGQENLINSVIGGMLALPLGAVPESFEAPPLELAPEDEIWRAPLTAFTSSPILFNGRIYETDATGELACVNPDSGEILWKEKLAPDQIHASPAAGDGKLYVPMNDGSFWVIRPSDEGPEVLCRVQLPGNCLGAPAICNGRVYVHTTEKLYCFGTGEGKFVAPGPVAVPLETRAPSRLMVRPGEVMLLPGESAAYHVGLVDELGNEVGTPAEDLVWEIPPTLALAIDGASGSIVTAADARPGVGVVKVASGGLSGSFRARIVPNLPYSENFDGIACKTPDPEKPGDGAALLGDPPGFWVGAFKKWDVRTVDGSQVLAKTLDNPLFQRSSAFFGHPDQTDYTMRCDIMTDGNRRTMSSAGLIHQRYLIQLKGNHQELEVSSNDWRLKVAVPFEWKAGTWYTLLTRVDRGAGESAVVRAKVWERGTDEPAAWTIEVPHAHAHQKGAPGIFSFSPQSRFRVYLDNLSVILDGTPPEAEASASGGGDWPMWGRDSTRNMVSDATGLPSAFVAGEFVGNTDRIDPESTTNVRWIAKLGSQCYGNATVSGGKVFVGTNNDAPRDPRFKGDRSVVMCFDEQDGSMRWMLNIPKLGTGKVSDWEFLGICSSPSVEGDRVYLVTNRCEVVCLDVNGMANGNDGPFQDEGQYLAGPGQPPFEVKETDGDIIWTLNMIDECGVFPHNITSSSVLIAGDKLWVTTSNGVDYGHVETPAPNAPSLILVDKATGALLGEEASGLGQRIFHCNWSSPAYYKSGELELCIFGGPDGWCYAFEPEPIEAEDGLMVLKERWRVDCNKPEYREKDGKKLQYATRPGPSEILATPVVADGLVYTLIGQDPEHGEGVGNIVCIDPTGEGDVTATKVLWSYDKIHRSISTPSVRDGRVYVADYSGFVFCLDSKTGKELWVHDTLGHIWGSTLVADGKVYIGNEDGYLSIIPATPEYDKEKVLEIDMTSSVYSSPVVANGTLYVATHTHLFAISAPKRDE